jgi:hypothetical protein
MFTGERVYFSSGAMTSGEAVYAKIEACRIRHSGDAGALGRGHVRMRRRLRRSIGGWRRPIRDANTNAQLTCASGVRLDSSSRRSSRFCSPACQDAAAATAVVGAAVPTRIRVAQRAPAVAQCRNLPATRLSAFKLFAWWDPQRGS